MSYDKKEEEKEKMIEHTDKRYIILDPSEKTKRTPCFDATLPSTWPFMISD